MQAIASASTDQPLTVAKSGTKLQLLVTIWMSCLIVFGRDFAALNVASIYINEVVLLILIANSYKYITSFDCIFFLITLIYFAAGYLTHGKLIFVVMDMTSLYFLMYLRFFPRDLAPKFIRIILFACYLHLAAVILARIGVDIGLSVRKYRTAPILIFCFLWELRSQDKDLSPILKLTFLVAAIASDFKALIIVMLPLMFFTRKSMVLASFFSTKVLWWFSMVICLTLYFNLVPALLYGTVSTLNFLTSIMGIEHTYSIVTSTWRLKIWAGLVRLFFKDVSFFIGDLPGRNFIDSKLLNLGKFIEHGSEAIGVNRYAHNFVLQIFTKMGLVGISTYFFYLPRWHPEKTPLSSIFYIIIFMAGLAAVILELPEAGPIAYGLMVILASKKEEKQLRSVTT